MKLLLIGPKVNDLANARNFSGVWAYYVRRELERLGIEHRFIPSLHKSGHSQTTLVRTYREMKFKEVDHIVALGTRYFDRIPRAIGFDIMKRIAGKVVQIHDGPTLKSPVHATFCVRKPPDAMKSVEGNNDNVWIGWAADEDVLVPNQPDGTLSILIDHPQLAGGEPEEYSQQVWNSISQFIKSEQWKASWTSVSVRRIVDHGIQVLGPRDLFQPLNLRYERSTVPFPDMAKHYSTSHLFFVTHPESVGMSVLETAMAGALPVVPNGCIGGSLLATIRYLRYNDLVIPWGEVLQMISPEQSRRMARQNSWSAVVRRMLNYLEGKV